MPSEKRRCTKCRKVRAVSSFNNDASRADGKFPWCKTCQAEKRALADRSFQDSEAPLNGKICPLCDTAIRGRVSRKYCSDFCRNRVNNLSREYGLDVADYRKLVADTGGTCHICGNRPTQWHVDHNHKTGLTTGVVCGPCNTGSLAMTFHDVGYVRRLLAYLEETPAARLGIEAKAPDGMSRPSTLHKGWRRPKF